MKQHFRRRTPEEDLATFEREPHAYGPLGMAAFNAAAYFFWRQDTALLAVAALESSIGAASVSYVNFRFRRGFKSLCAPLEASKEGEVSSLRHFAADAAPFLGISAMTGAVQSFVGFVANGLGSSELLDTAKVGGAAAVGLGAVAVGLELINESASPDKT